MHPMTPQAGHQRRPFRTLARPLAVLATAWMLSGVASAGDTFWITVGDEALQVLQSQSLAASVQPLRTVTPASNAQRGLTGGERVHLVKLTAAQMAQLSAGVHDTLKRCGGFVAHTTRADADATLTALASGTAPKLAALTRPSYTIAQQTVVNGMLPQMQATNIGQTITDMSSYANRYYTTTNGANAAGWLKNKWTTMTSGRSDIKVEAFTHSWKQTSVILTITGTDAPSEIVVMGAHLDSINGSGTTESTIAPGADDDASGIASLTEVIRVLVAGNYKPKRTLKFIGYSAEEVGLKGSADIAAQHATQGANVVGVMQLDMTNYQGSANDIYLYTDYTDATQNDFVAKLIQTYQPTLKIAYDKCGYGCSDHASWNAKGYYTSMPFESAFSQYNPKIHSSGDTYAAMGSQANHSLKFAKLALSYAVELGSGTGSGGGGTTTPQTQTFTGSLTLNQTKSFGPFKSAAGTAFTAKTTGTGDIDLYARKTSVPTTTTYDCKSDGSTSTESCSINVTATGDVYVLLKGYAAGNYSLTVNYATPKP